MYTIKCESSFDAAHFLSNYHGKCHNIHGHRWKILACIKGKLDNGMVADFSFLKSYLKELCDYFDHTFIVERGSLENHILNSLKGSIQKEYQVLSLTKEDFTKDYLLPMEIKKNDFSSSESLIVQELNFDLKEHEEKHFSKNTVHIVTKTEKENMRFGSIVHEVLEYLDFKNPHLEEIENDFIRKKIECFLNHSLLAKVEEATIYKEFEFLYEEENTTYHGIIDCLLEYDNHIDLIDYKLKNVTDEAYINQLNGYKTYLEKISNKKVNLYLYSIIDSKIEEIS